MDWLIVDAEERHRNSPDTFQIPSKVARNSLLPGDQVKLAFEPADTEEAGVGGERLWFEVIDVLDDGAYLGVFRNFPVFFDVDLEEAIEFTPENILDIVPKAKGQE